MLLNGYRKEIFRADCNPSFESVHCFAYIDEDAGEVFAAQAAEGAKGAEDCPPMNDNNMEKLQKYPGNFKLDY